jgi:pimeloyl-ACP methyl ester carboxylesterase
MLRIMKKALKITLKVLRWTTIVAVTLILLLLAFIEGFDRYIATERGAMWLYKEVPHNQKTIKFTSSGVRYFEIGDSEKPPLLLVHGAPGGFFDWLGVAKNEKIYNHYRLLIPERPGYGGTQPRGAVPSIKEQAERLLEVLEPETQEAIVMGHSYGAPIAAIMGALKPAKVSKIFGVSGQYDPDNEITFGISYLINYKIFAYLLPRFIWVANVEKLTHPDALREIIPIYDDIQVPVVLIHGDADSLVPYENSPFLLKHLNGNAEMITMGGADHPIHMQKADAMVDFVLPAK